MSRQDFINNLQIKWMSKREKEWFLVSTPINRVCEYEPKQAIRKGWTFSIPDADHSVIDNLQDYQDALKLKQKAIELFTLANQYGTAVLVINADDEQSSDRPLNSNNIRSIKGLYALHCYEIRGGFWESDPLNPDFYELISGFNQRPDTGFIIHNSRVIRADGITLPADLMKQNGGKSLSYPEMIGPAYLDWMYGSELLICALENQSFFIYELEGLIESLEDDILGNTNQEELRKRLEELKSNRSIYNGIAIDKDKENVGYATPFPTQGLVDIINHFKSELQARSGVSHTELWKEGTTGSLGAVGSAEQQDTVRAIQAFQEHRLAPVLDRLYNLIFLAKDGPSSGIIPKGWTYRFNPLEEPTEADRLAKIEKLSALLKTGQEMGWISPLEARETLKQSGADIGINFNDNSFWQSQQRQLWL